MTTEDRVKAVLVDTLGLENDEVTPDASLRDDLEMDSLCAVEVVMALEDEFELDGLPMEDVEKLKQVKDVTQYIEGRIDHQKGE